MSPGGGGSQSWSSRACRSAATGCIEGSAIGFGNSQRQQAHPVHARRAHARELGDRGCDVDVEDEARIGPRCGHARVVPDHEAYVKGMCRRKVDELIRALGREHVSRSRVSRICSQLGAGAGVRLPPDRGSASLRQRSNIRPPGTSALPDGATMSPRARPSRPGRCERAAAEPSGSRREAELARTFGSVRGSFR